MWNSTAGATIDALTLAQVVSAEMASGLLIDIGCGNGNVGIHIARQHPDITVVGIDLSLFKCKEAALFHTLHISNFHVVCGDMCFMPFSRADAVCSNPPLLPGEPGFILRSPRGARELFWHLLVEEANSHGVHLIYIHLYDFHGIEERTGDWLCLEEVALREGYRVTYPYRGVRYVGLSSNIRSKIPALRDYFPNGKFFWIIA